MATAPLLSTGGSGAIVDTGSPASPQTVSSTISIPSDLRARIFVKSNGGTVTGTLQNGTNAQELHIYGVDNSNPVKLVSGSNLELSGELLLKSGTYAILHWVPSKTKWVEASRNEI